MDKKKKIILVLAVMILVVVGIILMKGVPTDNLPSSVMQTTVGNSFPNMWAKVKFKKPFGNPPILNP